MLGAGFCTINVSLALQKLAAVGNRKLEASLGRTASLSPSRQVSAVYGTTLHADKGAKHGDIVRNLKDKNKALSKVLHCIDAVACTRRDVIRVLLADLME